MIVVCRTFIGPDDRQRRTMHFGDCVTSLGAKRVRQRLVPFLRGTLLLLGPTYVEGRLIPHFCKVYPLEMNTEPGVRTLEPNVRLSTRSLDFVPEVLTGYDNPSLAGCNYCVPTKYDILICVDCEEGVFFGEGCLQSVVPQVVLEQYFNFCFFYFWFCRRAHAQGTLRKVKYVGRRARQARNRRGLLSLVDNCHVIIVRPFSTIVPSSSVHPGIWTHEHAGRHIAETLIAHTTIVPSHTPFPSVSTSYAHERL
jgi:hypothetical protein